MSETYREAGDAIHDAIKASILKADGFVNCSNNKFDKKDKCPKPDSDSICLPFWSLPSGA